MERPISQGELEASVVRLCAPVLLGAKSRGAASDIGAPRPPEGNRFQT